MENSASEQDPWKHFKPKYQVHREAYTFYKRLSEVGGNCLPFDFHTLAEAREHDRRVFTALAGSFDFSGTTYEVNIPLDTSESGILVAKGDNNNTMGACGNENEMETSNDSQQHITAQVYQPCKLKEKPTIWVYFHGGGHVLGCCDTYKTALQMIADNSGSIVVNVEYRLLPHEDRCAPLHDCVAATKWVAQNKDKIGGNWKSKIGIGGDSSGGHITACVAFEVPDLDFQILVYPFTDPGRMQLSRTEFANDPLLSEKQLNWSFDLTIGQMPNYLTDPRINPMIGDVDKTRCPPALFIISELDPFRDDGVVYARKLDKAGVDVRVVTMKEIPHFFFNLPDTFPTTCRKAYNEISSFINDIALRN